MSTAARAIFLRVTRAARRGEDALTGLPTRGAGQSVLDALRAGDAVAMIDLDGLKDTNDTLGHAAGDGELVALAQHLASGIRRGDTIARWGGDEFVVVLRAGGDAGADVIDRLRSSSPVGFSAGMAVHRDGSGTETLAEADAALLAAKRAGGSQVVAA
ncbi:MAG: GGDEF domain-containing protein [Actinobacteria bacterium]|nr:GGDEF domain-containing protein [Actinomycetota bacterium]